MRFVLILTPTAYASDPSAWYPGDRYVDWIGTDAYNFGGCKAGVSGWRSLAAAAGAFYQWASARGKPLLLAEFGSAADRDDPDRQADWLQQAAATLADWPSMKAVIYFDQIGTCDWRLQNSPATMAAFRDFARSAAANSDPTARLLPQSATTAAPRLVSFTAAASTGGGHGTGSGVDSWTLDPATAPRSSGDRANRVRSRTSTYDQGLLTARLTVTDASGARAVTESVLKLG